VTALADLLPVATHVLASGQDFEVLDSDARLVAAAVVNVMPLGNLDPREPQGRTVS